MFRVNLSVQVMMAGLDSNPQPLDDKASGLPLCQCRWRWPIKHNFIIIFTAIIFVKMIEIDTNVCCKLRPIKIYRTGFKLIK